MRHNSLRRGLVALALGALALVAPAMAASAAPPDGPPSSAQSEPYRPQELSEEYVRSESMVGREHLPSYLRAYPNCITAQPLIVTTGPTRQAIIPTTNSGTANCVLGVGNQGYAVQVLQSALNACRGAGLVVDGVFGQATKTAVKNVQAAYGLTVDGVYGPATRSKPIWPALSPYTGCWGFSY
jgi:hypothetical protein